MYWECFCNNELRTGCWMKTCPRCYLTILLKSIAEESLGTCDFLTLADFQIILPQSFLKNFRLILTNSLLWEKFCRKKISWGRKQTSKQVYKQTSGKIKNEGCFMKTYFCDKHLIFGAISVPGFPFSIGWEILHKLGRHALLRDWASPVLTSPSWARAYQITWAFFEPFLSYASSFGPDA